MYANGSRSLSKNRIPTTHVSPITVTREIEDLSQNLNANCSKYISWYLVLSVTSVDKKNEVRGEGDVHIGARPTNA